MTVMTSFTNMCLLEYQRDQSIMCDLSASQIAGHLIARHRIEKQRAETMFADREDNGLKHELLARHRSTMSWRMWLHGHGPSWRFTQDMFTRHRSAPVWYAGAAIFFFGLWSTRGRIAWSLWRLLGQQAASMAVSCVMICAKACTALGIGALAVARPHFGRLASGVRAVVTNARPALAGPIRGKEEMALPIEPFLSNNEHTHRPTTVANVVTVPSKQRMKLRPSRRCARCGIPAPEKYRWKANCCELCHARFRMGMVPGTAIVTLQHYIDSGLSVPYPTSYGGLIAPSLHANPKMKPLRVGASCPMLPEGPIDAFTHTHNVKSGCEGKKSVHRSPVLATIGIASTIPTVFAKTDHNLATAVRTRLCASPPGHNGTGQPRRGFWAESIQLLERPEIVELLFRDYGDYHSGAKRVIPMTYEEWKKGFPKARGKMFDAALALYRKKPIPLGRMVKFDVFVKREKANNGAVLLKGHTEPPPANPRSICNPPEITHVLTGPWCRQLTKQVKHMLSIDGPVYYASDTPEGQNEWINREYPLSGDSCQPCHVQMAVDGATVKAPGRKFTAKNRPKTSWAGVTRHVQFRPTRAYPMNDYSMMDNSYSKEAFRFLRAFYRKLGFPKTGLVANLWWQLGKVSGKLTHHGERKKFEAGYVNASGRDDTAVNNAVINAWLSFLGWLAAGHAAEGLAFSIPTLDVQVCRRMAAEMRIGIVGDDLGGAVPLRWRQHTQAVEDIAAEGGFSCKMSYANNVDELVFLGMRPYPVAVLEDGVFRKRLRWGKMLGRCLYKLGWQLQPTVDALAWGKGVAWATLIGDNHVPILRAYALAVLRRTEGINMKVPTDLWKFHLTEEREQRVLTTDTFDMMQRVYGLDYVAIDQLERAFLELPELPCVISHPSLDRVLEVDAEFM